MTRFDVGKSHSTRIPRRHPPGPGLERGTQIDRAKLGAVPGGLDLARAIKLQRRTLPIVLMTGYSDAAASAAAEDIDLLVKPYTLEALSDTLRGAMIAAA